MADLRIKKAFKEEGILVGKEHKLATEGKEFKNSSGDYVKIDAQPEKYIFKVVSSDDIDPISGMATPSLAEIEVPVEVYALGKYLSKVLVVLEMSTTGIFKAIGCKLIEDTSTKK